MLHKQPMFAFMALVIPFAVAAVATSTAPNSAVAASKYQDLCDSTGVDAYPDDDERGRGGCMYAAWDAPVLEAEVCWDGQLATLKGSAPCSSDAYAFHVRHGEVLDPTSNEVAAYVPLPDTCKYTYCPPVPAYQPPPLEDGTACCDPEGNCVSPDANGMCTVGDITWCKELEHHNDGTVTCYE